MTVTSFKVPKKFVTLMDQLIDKGLYSSRGDLIRCAIAEYIADLTFSHESESKSKQWSTQTNIAAFLMSD